MTSKKGLPVLRIIDGIAYRGQPGQQLRVTAHDLGNGHLELSAVRVTEWKELELDAFALQDYLDMLRENEADPELQAERQARRVKIAANRAKTKVRRLCKALGVTTLLTLTYRANETDLHQVKKDLKEFNRRMLRVMPEFRFVAGFERQERGAYHVHMGTAGIPTVFLQKNAAGVPTRVKSFDVIRAVWRSVTKERGGNIDVSRRKRHSTSTPASIAKYLAKYITKEFEDGEKHSNRYTSYGAASAAKGLDFGKFNTAREAVEFCYSLLSGHVVFDQHFSRWGDWFFMHCEKPLAPSSSAST
ncbi:MAG: hypothetical protein Q8O29_08580 [Polaromonas sp.]|uniref:rolling circle replication-associated protein n=1 Tax=Polaromonas sp. TaxID=1869339 RepID=UPI0027357CC2|nr:hypothetical protein [Polaromonas sp.]MDP2818321.1 hypothetical protein [Polaromonas sp.]